ncbi:RagB/SusD family nutrient uptake outer membrane protein [Daejeonella lutea]|uniref:SusD family protein n=1 Tax=Daejeonella lutea TaxID=572036 RepID=A0A1T5B0H7_9SPHI|nr:RagB/SusD family nutrient uptake outer membrane protein [Daejeonella lutea]SKB40373.1 SusD family protein [Daejeonella lutea]
MKIKYSLIILLSCLSISCEKYLEVKPDKKLAVPSDNLSNLKLLLDDTNTMNQQVPALGEAASDNIFIRDTQFDPVAQVSITSVNSYLWQSDVFNDKARNDWALPYAVIINTNLVLEGTDKIQPRASEQQLWNTVKGSALLFRSFAFYTLLQEFARPYNVTTASQDPGIVLKLNSDINEVSKRSSVRQCYDKIVSDLTEAVKLLPENVTFRTEPTTAAGYALLARVYLSMNDYSQSLINAEKALQLFPTLMDYNSLSAAATFPFKRYNEEVIFHASLVQDRALAYPYACADEILYNEYRADDLRKSLFFRRNGPADIQFRGSYVGSLTNFGGMASDELYLIAAECASRIGNRAKALDYLNKLAAKRYKQPGFVNFQAGTDQEALDLILKERRKELLFRNLRWGDINRLKAEARYRTTITKVSKGVVYVLPAEKNYVFLIPRKVIEASGMAQN